MTEETSIGETPELSGVLERSRLAADSARDAVQTLGVVAASEADAAIYAANMTCVRRKFPEVAGILDLLKTLDQVEKRETEQGPVIYEKGQCLDHPQKPRAAAEQWVKRALQETRIAPAAALLVYGFGAGYHLEPLLDRWDKPIMVIEPSAAVLKLALSSRDLRPILERLSALQTSIQSRNPEFDGAEMLIRPQTAAGAPEHCAITKSTFYGVRGLTALAPRIGVVGPLNGGSLPIMAYSVRALHELKQKVRELDMSGFSSGLDQVERFVSDRYRVAGLQGMYVEMVSHVLFESMTEKPLDIFICMAQAPVSVRLLTELRKQGVITVLWFMEDYLRFTYWRDMARYYDFVFTIQRGEAIDAIKSAGAGEVHYLPVGCDPMIHAPVQLNADERRRWGSEVSFVGAGYYNRQQVFASLSELPFKIWGTEWPGCRPFDRLVQEEGRRLSPAEYVRIFSATDININLHSSTERDGVDPYGDFVNPRTFELAAAGAFQLVDKRTHLGDLFEVGSEIITFDSVRDLKDKIEYYRSKPEERANIAARGRARALSEHTYEQRLRTMLEVIYSSRYEQLKRREESSPWKRMLSRTVSQPELHQRCKAAQERGEEAGLDGLISDVVGGHGKLSETEQKLLFLFHVRKQIIRMKVEELGDKAPEAVRAR